jgi:hypothetical protein
MTVDQIEQNADPFRRRKTRVIFFVRSLGFLEAAKDLDDPLHERSLPRQHKVNCHPIVSATYRP